MKILGIATSLPEKEDEFSACMFELFKRNESRFIQAGKLCQHLISLHRLSLHDELVAKLQDFGLAFPTICTRPVIYFNSRKLAKSEGYWKSPPHQDWRSMQGSLNSMVVWIPLIDIPHELGALEVAPKSHLRGLFESDPDDWYRTIKAEYLPGIEFTSVETHAGDALFFSSFLAHRSGTNTTERIRWSAHFRYNDALEPTYSSRSFPNPYVYYPKQDLITEGFPSIDHLKETFKR
jgi:ectoine hydroxylase-related dioxygenase (phytanoyl-CoA dioxygenase family)